jgi:hypothetical protein
VSDPSLADEVRKFAHGLQEWARGFVADPHQGHKTTSTCDWCPLCQFADVLRSDNPEVSDRIAEAGTAVLTALRAVVDAAAAQQSRATKSEARPRPRPRPAPAVQHISLDEPE